MNFEKQQDKLAQLELEDRLKKGHRSILKQFKDEMPELASRVDCRQNTIVWKKRPKGYSKVIPSFVDLMCNPENVKENTSSIIRRGVQVTPQTNYK